MPDLIVANVDTIATQSAKVARRTPPALGTHLAVKLLESLGLDASSPDIVAAALAGAYLGVVGAASLGGPINSPTPKDAETGLAAANVILARLWADVRPATSETPQ